MKFGFFNLAEIVFNNNILQRFPDIGRCIAYTCQFLLYGSYRLSAEKVAVYFQVFDMPVLNIEAKINLANRKPMSPLNIEAGDFPKFQSQFPYFSSLRSSTFRHSSSVSRYVSNLSRSWYSPSSRCCRNSVILIGFSRNSTILATLLRTDLCPFDAILLILTVSAFTTSSRSLSNRRVP